MNAQSFMYTPADEDLDSIQVWSGGIQPSCHDHPCVVCGTQTHEALVLSIIDWVELNSLKVLIEKMGGHMEVDNTRWQNAAFAHIGLCPAHHEVGVVLQRAADVRGVLDEEDIRSALSAGKSPGT